MRKLKLHELNRLSVSEFKTTKKNNIVVVLDNIRSMHNVGSVFRSCDAFLVEKLWLCGYTPRPPHREIRKTAIGAEESVSWEHAEDILSLLEVLKSEGYILVAAEQTISKSLLPDFTTKSDEKYALIFGNEIDGVQQEVLNSCDHHLEIPQYGTKHSLNVAVSVGIFLFHFCQ